MIVEISFNTILLFAYGEGKKSFAFFVASTIEMIDCSVMKINADIITHRMPYFFIRSVNRRGYRFFFDYGVRFDGCSKTKYTS